MTRPIGTRWVTSKTQFWNAGVTLIQEDGYVQIIGELGNIGPAERHPMFDPDKMVLRGWESIGERSQNKHTEVDPIQVGDRVKIRPTSLYYGANENNPRDQFGTVIDVDLGEHEQHPHHLYITVDWDRSGENTYHHNDLIVTSETSVKKALPVGSVRDHVKKAIDQLMSEEYGGHVMYEVISGDISFKQGVIRGACHAQVNRNMTPAKLVIASRINKKGVEAKRGTEEDAVFYYDWLFNRSPLARAFITKKAQRAWDKGYILTSCRVPANLMQAANVSLRQPWEAHNNNVKLFRKYVQEAGMPENAAWVLAELTSGVDHKLEVPHRSHSMFMWCDVRAAGIARFIKGDLGNFTERYCDNNVYSGADNLLKRDGDERTPLNIHSLPSVSDVLRQRQEVEQEVYVNIFALSVQEEVVEAISLPDRVEWARILNEDIQKVLLGETT